MSSLSLAPFPISIIQRCDDGSLQGNLGWNWTDFFNSFCMNFNFWLKFSIVWSSHVMPESHMKASSRNKKETENFLVNVHFSLKTYWEWRVRGKGLSIGYYVKLLAHHITYKALALIFFMLSEAKYFNSIKCATRLSRSVMKEVFDVAMVI